MVTNAPEISGAYHKDIYLSPILHVHCRLATQVLQVNRAAVIGDISGLLEEGIEKARDHVASIKASV